MNSHKNAPLTPKGREAMVRFVIDGGLSKAAAARQFSRPTSGATSPDTAHDVTFCTDHEIVVVAPWRTSAGRAEIVPVGAGG